MTEILFREDAYLRETPATVVSADPRGITLDRTVFYPRGGGQPGDQGALFVADGARIDWEKRYKRMRAHTAPHLLSVALPYPVTGGSVGDAEGRLDFDCEAPLDEADLERKLNALGALDAPVGQRWISEEELDANPGLVKTLSVKPPRGAGKIRLVAIEGLDLQPCGGTHVARAGEIGRISVARIEKKGRINRRVGIVLADPERAC